jgi:predicted dehydrogenase
MASTSPYAASRRSFLRQASAGALTLGFPAILRAQNAGDHARIAVIGAGGQGGGHCSSLLPKAAGEEPDSAGGRLVAVADCDYEHGDGIRSRAKKVGQEVEVYQDYRKLLENKNIDGVIIATPNHLHSMIGIHALQAGKHIYVEKPVSHNVWEGRQLAKCAAQNPHLVAMHGMQRRSAKGWSEIEAYLADKNCPLGKVLLSRGLCYKKRENIGKVSGPQEPPKGVDYSLWSGPREVLPIMRKKFHYDWHWQWPYGNGDIGNQGPHQLDVARRMVGDPDLLPGQVICIGGRFGYEDDATTANTQIVFYDYKPVPVIMEVRGLPRSGMNFGLGTPKYLKTGIDVGNIIHCEGGMIAEGTAYDKDGKRIRQFGDMQGGSHRAHFVQAIKAGKLLSPGHGVLTGHHAAALAHMGNISYRMGTAQGDAEAAKTASFNALYAEAYATMKQHLADNGIDIDAVKATVGPMLNFDSKAEVFTGAGAEAANKLATDDYRAEFSIKV